jgi:hypothetical protein
MKIAIMTYWWSEDNYGQILQCYALQKYLRDVGHDAYLIRYDPRNDFVKTPVFRKILKVCDPVQLYRFLVWKIKKHRTDGKLTYILELNKERRFFKFKDKYIKYSTETYHSHQELAEHPPEADMYIVGSDQVWNFYQNRLMKVKPQVKAYFLDFGNDSIKRIAYAASFGKEELENDFIREIAPLLKRFNYVSVREKTGLDICHQCGVDTAEWVPDPTMLLKADIYRALYDNKCNKPKQPYCLLYLLGNKYDFSIKRIYDWAQEKELVVFYVSANDEYALENTFEVTEKVYATIPQWLYLIDNAEYVITNSYHCSVFSLIFNKKFAIISLVNMYKNMNTRFTSLFEYFNIENRFINDSFEIFNKKISWNNVNERFQKIYSFDYFKGIIS